MPHFILVSGGKGGVGRSTIAINMGAMLSKIGRNVLLIDSDLGMGQITTMLDLPESHHMGHFFARRCSLKDALCEGPYGLKVLKAPSGLPDMLPMANELVQSIEERIVQGKVKADIVLVDTTGGIGQDALAFSSVTDDVLLVLHDEPTSIANAYTQMKHLYLEYGILRFHVVVNEIRTLKEGKMCFEKLALIANKFLNVSLDYLGAVPYDEQVRQAIAQQKSVVEYAPSCHASTAISKLANAIDAWPAELSP